MRSTAPLHRSKPVHGKGRMTARRADGRRQIQVAAATAALALCVSFPGVLAGTAPAQAGGMIEAAHGSVAVGIDQARALRLPGAAHLVAVGNPSIADAIIQEGDMLLLVGRSFGATNILVFGTDGRELASYMVNVVDASPRLVTLNRGTARLSYNCAPHCERILKVGDDPDAVKDIAEQTGSEQGLATEGAEATAAGTQP